jgi:hypothetical protein
MRTDRLRKKGADNVFAVCKSLIPGSHYFGEKGCLYPFSASR